MADRVVPAEVVTDLVERLAGTPWPRPAGDLDATLAELGWTTGSRSEHGVVARTGLAPGAGLAFVQLVGDRTDEVALDLSDPFGDDTRGRAGLQDAFVQAVRAVGAALGEPTGRRPGPRPELRWRGGDATVLVTRLAEVVQLRLVPNRTLDGVAEADRRGL